MNWFQLNDGHWVNLCQATDIVDEGNGQVTIYWAFFDPDDACQGSTTVEEEDAPRLLAHIRSLCDG